MTLTGTGFDSVTEDTTIEFSDDTICIIESASDVEVTCTVDGFDVDQLDWVNPYTITVTVNEVVNSDHTVMILSTKQSG